MKNLQLGLGVLAFPRALNYLTLRFLIEDMYFFNSESKLICTARGEVGFRLV